MLGQASSGALPVPPTVLVGREADLDALTASIAELAPCVVTLVGPGGVGKTRLAIAAAERLDGDFADGARFVSLAAVARSADLVPAIGRALAVPGREGDTPMAALCRFLGDRRMLLVLDNFEQLVDGAPLVAELLAACPALSILMTSREPTRLAAERLYPVRPLDVPDTTGAASASELARYGAVTMFVDRARARDPGFALDDVTAPHVGEICRRLDGLPLALELAAARIGLLTPAELAARLDKALAVLAGGPRDAPERHRTLRATIDWSFGLLGDSERETFAHFAVFAGGATVAAAERVTGATLDTLASLVAKQLLVRRGDRLLMLETVREYALERLAESAGSDAVHERLASWALDFVREATPHLVKADRTAWLTRLDAELPNVLAALAWALASQRGELALHLSSELGAYSWRTRLWEPGLVWIDATLEQTPEGPARARAAALLNRARLVGGRHPRYQADLQASLKLFRACDDPGGTAVCLGCLAKVELWEGRPAQALALSDEAVRLATSAQDEEVIADVFAQRVTVAGDYDETARVAGIALGHLRRVGNLHDAANICDNTGYMAIAEHRYAEALPWLAEALKAAGPLSDPKLLFFIRGNHGLALLFLDELDESERAFRDALAVFREGGCEDLVDEALRGLAAVSARRGALDRAARLSGSAERHTPSARAPVEIAIDSRLNDELAAAREAYGPESWDRACSEGASLTAHEAIDLALGRPAPTDDAPTVASAPRGPERRVVAGRYRLLARLGRGAMKEVYLAYDERLDREVALGLGVGAGASEAARDRFAREARVTGRLGDHPNVITVHDTGEHEGVPYLVLRAMKGGSLADLIERGTPSIADTLRLGRQIAAALAHAHAHGVVHRDVKPDNVWLAADGVAALGDFGIAKQPGGRALTKEGVVLGTVRYLSPEQIRGDDAVAASDLYALGVTLYELVSGRPPFTAPDPGLVLTQHLSATPVAPSEHDPAVPRALERLILELLAKDPAQRPPSAARVEQELAGMLAAPRGATAPSCPG